MSSDNLGEYSRIHEPVLGSIFNYGYVLAQKKPDYDFRADVGAGLEGTLTSYDWRFSPDEAAKLDYEAIERYFSATEEQHRARLTHVDTVHHDLIGRFVSQYALQETPPPNKLDRNFYYREIQGRGMGKMALTAARIVHASTPKRWVRQLEITDADNDFRADGLTIFEALGVFEVRQQKPGLRLPTPQDLTDLSTHLRLLGDIDRYSR